MLESIVIKNLKKTFTLSKKQMKIDRTTDNKKVAVDGISLSTYKGEIFGLLGPNGAGKTTTLRCVATLIKADEGEISINGIPISDETEIKRNIAFLTNELKLDTQFTPNYLFEYFSRFYDIDEVTMNERRDYLFKKFGVDKFAEVKIGELSTGMSQKVSIAVSLVNDPDVIIFDEPTNGLDVLTAKTVTDFLLELRDRGKSIIISTHIMNLVESLCDRVGIIIDGKLTLCDTVENVLASYPGMDIEDVFFKIFSEVHDEERL